MEGAILFHYQKNLFRKRNLRFTPVGSWEFLKERITFRKMVCKKQLFRPKRFPRRRTTVRESLDILLEYCGGPRPDGGARGNNDE